jgi:hypothetical protein
LARAQEKQRKELDIQRRFAPPPTPASSPSASFASGSSDDDITSKDTSRPHRTRAQSLKPLTLVRQRAGTWSAERSRGRGTYGSEEPQSRRRDKSAGGGSASGTPKGTHWCLDVECLESTVAFESATALEEHLRTVHMLTQASMHPRRSNHARARWQDHENKLAGRERYKSDAHMLELDEATPVQLKTRAKQLRQSIKRKSARVKDESLPALVREVFNTTIASEKAQLKAIMAQSAAEHSAAQYERTAAAQKAAEARVALANARKRQSMTRVKAKTEAEAQGKRKGREELRRLSRARDRTSLRARSQLFQVIHQHTHDADNSATAQCQASLSDHLEAEALLASSSLVYRPRRVSEPTLAAQTSPLLAVEQQRALGRNGHGRRGSTASTNRGANAEVLSGWVSKLAIRSKRNWTTRFVSFNAREMHLVYYKPKPKPSSSGGGARRSSSSGRGRGEGARGQSGGSQHHQPQSRRLSHTMQPQSHPQGVFEILMNTVVTELAVDAKLPNGTPLAWVSSQLPGRTATSRRRTVSSSLSSRARSTTSASSSASSSR